MKILVTGARGMLGKDVCAALSRRGHEVTALASSDLDIADPAAANRVLAAAAPQTLVNCAAFTDVDGAESQPDAAMRANALGCGVLASACERVGCEMISVSTDFVFDGSKREPYIELDPIAPLGVYGRSKAAGEAMIRAACTRHKIVRTAWLYGAGGKCFPKTILRAARSRAELKVVADQTGSPTYTVDLAEALSDLAQIPVYGTYHLTNSGQCTWCELAREALRLAGMSQVSVIPIVSEEWPTPTERPKFSVLRPYLWELLGRAPLRPWQDALADFVKALPPDDV